MKKKILVVGGGFRGIVVADKLRKAASLNAVQIAENLWFFY